MDTLLGIAVGLGLSAACGFRVFVPLLVMNLASLSGQLHLASGFAWIGSSYATVAFATATIVEVLSYFIPGLIMPILIGIAGSFLAGLIGQFIGWYNAGEGAGFIASIIVAIILLVIYGKIKGKTSA